MLNAHQLNIFTIAAETLSFTEAAKRLHLTQSSVSQHVKSLETQLGTTLFQRQGRTIELTDAGRVLLPLAKDIIKDSIRAEERIKLLDSKVHGHLIIGCNTAPGKYALPVLLSQFHKLYPLVKITCQVLPQNQAVERVLDGSVHFALTNISLEQESLPDFQLYIQEPIVLIVSNNHPWAELGEIPVDKLYEEQFIMREDTSGTYSSVKEALTKSGVNIEDLDTFLIMGNSEAIALSVREGLGVGFVSNLIMKKLCNDDVAIVKLTGVEIFQDIYFGRQTRDPSTGAQAAFWDFISTMDIEPLL
jgi:DNA-binding transcriptional LysR family regulator